MWCFVTFRQLVLRNLLSQAEHAYNTGNLEMANEFGHLATFQARAVIAEARWN